MQSYQVPQGLLKNRVILVTGSSDGIGAAAAKAYAESGASVILHGRSVEKLEKVYDEICAAGNPQPAILPLDLLAATKEQYHELAKTIESEFGRLDGILHNAGILKPLSPIEFTAEEDWQQTMQVNTTAVFMLTKACLALLNQSPSASVIMTSSGVGTKGRAFWGPYAVSKFAIEGLVQVLAEELETGPIRVNAINPGATRTKMRATAYPAEDPNKLPSPEAIIPAYLYLMGDDSLAVNGQSINAQSDNWLNKL
jgi:NAD(P)-dependent dehydrogenase (short-subunit alcohol dehydrogenase family)